ncbi:hypothetical protein ACH42_17115 [Endozoicomonas sp. (ex Bugula neritina AB1)]|nr:hypothetical protein ACH42_17115 [Endozoicomonas sp. (ex Bugula neritina AB1)]
MKPFSQWLTDLTEDLRKREQEPHPAPEKTSAMDYNAIHQPLISAIKSVMWRDQNQLPMEGHIHAKISKVIALYSKIRHALDREVSAGLRSRKELDEYDLRVGQWIRELEIVASKTAVGDVPKVNPADHYQTWVIGGI